MSDLDELLQRGFDDLASGAPHDNELANTIRRRSRYRRAITIAPVAAAVAVVAVVCAVMLVHPGAVGPSAQPTSACGPVETAVIPTWARAGFSDAEPSMPFVTSRSGHVIAILFNNPLRSPRSPGRATRSCGSPTMLPAVRIC